MPLPGDFPGRPRAGPERELALARLHLEVPPPVMLLQQPLQARPQAFALALRPLVLQPFRRMHREPALAPPARRVPPAPASPPPGRSAPAPAPSPPAASVAPPPAAPPRPGSAAAAAQASSRSRPASSAVRAALSTMPRSPTNTIRCRPNRARKSCATSATVVASLRLPANTWCASGQPPTSTSPGTTCRSRGRWSRECP